MSRFFLPSGYVERINPSYHDDVDLLISSITFQPEIYPVAEKLLLASGRRRIIDIGCGNGSKLVASVADTKIGIDFGSNIDFCNKAWGERGKWLVADLETPLDPAFLAGIGPSDVIICSDVIEHLNSPLHLLISLRTCFEQGALIITSTPDRDLVRGKADKGPPANDAHVREWAIDEYAAMLAMHGLPSLFTGYTLNNDRDKLLRTIVTLHEPRLQLGFSATIVRPLAIISSFNEEDVIREVVMDLLAQGCDVHVMDNWSKDSTWDILERMQVEFGRRLIVERFPQHEATSASWRHILSRKEDIAACHKGRWIIHTDADEIRRGFGPEFRLSDYLAAVQCAGWNRVDFTVVNCRPTDERDFIPGTLLSHLRHFEFGDRPGHFVQKKAWLQGSRKVMLAESGGHISEFKGANDCPYLGLLQHYPLRSVAHARKKIEAERHQRWVDEEVKGGWHSQYDSLRSSGQFVWERSRLHSLNGQFWRHHGLQVLTGIRR